jgi:hypothetical protein
MAQNVGKDHISVLRVLGEIPLTIINF